MNRKTISYLLMLSLGLSACSSRPRSFAPKLSAAPASEMAYQQQLLDCRRQVAARMDKSGRLGSAAGGAAIGAGATAAAGAAVAGTTYGTMGAAMAAAGAVLAVAPVTAIFGAWGVAKMKRSKKEKAIKAAMAQCLAQGGYQIAGWDALSKRQAKELMAEVGPAGSKTATAAGN